MNQQHLLSDELETSEFISLIFFKWSNICAYLHSTCTSAWMNNDIDRSWSISKLMLARLLMYSPSISMFCCSLVQRIGKPANTCDWVPRIPRKKHSKGREKKQIYRDTARLLRMQWADNLRRFDKRSNLMRQAYIYRCKHLHFDWMMLD